jgi:hypothetical protein
VVAVASVVTLSCNRNTPTQQTDVPAAPLASAATPAAQLESSSTDHFRQPEFDPEDFVGVVDNRFHPLRPGTRFIYVGKEDGEPQKTITDVTHGQKTILGVEVVVVLDRVFQSGALKEKTLDWYAQDEDGNVWYMGEDTKTYENGKVVSTLGSWEAGKNGAKAGIIMLAHPRVGQTYQQEFARGVAEDKARVVAINQKVSVPYGRFTGCLKTEEFTPLDPGATSVKWYCPGIGFVKGDDVTGGTGHSALAEISR